MGCKCVGGFVIIAGLFLLLNTFWMQWDLGLILGIMVIIAGIVTITKPNCQGGTCCAGEQAARKEQLVKIKKK